MKRDKFLVWLDTRINAVQQENEENDYRVYWDGNDINGCDALRVLRTVRKRYTEAR